MIQYNAIQLQRKITYLLEHVQFYEINESNIVNCINHILNRYLAYKDLVEFS